MKYEDFCKMIGIKPDEERDFYGYGVNLLMVECKGVGFFFCPNTHEFKYYSNNY